MGSSSTGSAGRPPVENQLWIETPLIHSLPISKRAAVPIYLKLDALQCSGSFKDRGIGHFCQILKKSGVTKLISSSGGNAGHAVANSGRVLGMSVAVVVPETTKQIMIDKIQAHGAEVTVHGENWNAADKLARQMVADDEQAEYVHPYDHPTIWTGHSTMIDEIVESGTKPGAIVACVGGGGMLCGIYEGLKRHGWDDVPVITAETDGAASFAKAFESGQLVKLDAIESIATSLGALQVSEQALARAQSHPTTALTVSDKEAVEACLELLTDHRLLVEPACGAALSVVYNERFQDLLRQYSSVLVIVCGGGGVTLDIVQEWKQQLIDAP
jgi:L-serine/L-threonine ammonia-lyase